MGERCSLKLPPFTLKKKEWNAAIYSNLNGLREYYTCELNQTKKDKYYDITYMWNLKNNTSDSVYKTETDSQA